tara:strand:- start:48 stop:443 length:396 start_codon:yes stop_codon:yes gene_type:complete
MTDNIIRFPNKSFKPRPKITPEEEKRILTLAQKRVADNTAEGLAVDILTVLQEHISSMQKDEFIADLAFLIEVVKATLHREIGLHHPVQDIVDKVCKVMTAKNGEKVTHLNYTTILERPEEDQIDIEFEPE